MNTKIVVKCKKKHLCYKLRWILFNLVHILSLRPSKPFCNLRSTIHHHSFAGISGKIILFQRESNISYSKDDDDGKGVSKNTPEIRERKNNDYFISPDQIAALKESVDIVSVIESYNLEGFTRKGDQSAMAICPFHADTNPSLSISGDRKMFKCFSCGEGGDIFKFVRSYSALGGGEAMTFYESVQHIAKDFGDDNIGINIKSLFKSNTRETDAIKKKKQRLRLCNMAAADFFAKNLIHLPIAGQTRAYLRHRKISPATVQRFALGYAGDSYFKPGCVWGEGSLVEYLRSYGFSAQEIEDAGLATRSKKSTYKNVFESQNSDKEKDMDTFEGLMDRFRERVIVPIFDETGKNVIAFGGRIINSTSTGNNSTRNQYQPPKYLNSPETPIFTKKLELFGLPFAVEAIYALKKEADFKGKAFQSSVVIVEGYMDVIALWEAGVQETVASMGTALTQDQLSKAAKTVGTGGRIILCLDNDEAGRMAIERICSSLILSKTCEKYAVEIVVATLPKGVKDPAEYFENKSRSSDGFKSEVLDQAVEWSLWYIQTLLLKYNSEAIQGTPGSFADTCERVADFIATFPLPTDRSKRAYEVSKDLAKIIAKSSSSQTLQIQLESDLLNMVARKAAGKNAMERRIESIEGYKSQNGTLAINRILEGGSSSISIEHEKLARNASKNHKMEQFNRMNIDKKERNESKSYSRPLKTRKRRMRIERKTFTRPEPLTPHFTGVDIENLSDAKWLEIPREKQKRNLKDLTVGASLKNREESQNIVFFNSNDFHGDQYLTEEARNAGYSKGKVKKDPAFLEKGIGIFLVEDNDSKVKTIEERLLRILVQHKPARSAMDAVISTADATGVRPEIDWSSYERSWLFDFLVFRNNEIPTDIAGENTEKLWGFLSCTEDAPQNAFISSPCVIEESRNHLVAPTSTETVQHKAIKVVNTIMDDEDNELEFPIADSDQNDDFKDYDLSLEDMDIQKDESILEPDKLEHLDTKNMDKNVISPYTVIDAKICEPELSAESDIIQHEKSDVGSLDIFFKSSEDIFKKTRDKTVKLSYQAELEAQEALAYLLRASTAKKLNNVNTNWLLASNLLNARLGEEGDGSSTMSGLKELDSMNIIDLEIYCNSLMTRLKELSEIAQHLDTSARKISMRLMEYSVGDATEGKIPIAKQEEVINMVDDFVDSLPEEFEPANIKGLLNPMYVLSRFEDNDIDENDPPPMYENYDAEEEEIGFEKDMLIMKDFWGHMQDESYVWSAPISNSAEGRAMVTHSDVDSEQNFAFEEEEPIEEAIARIEDEWGDWGDLDPESLVLEEKRKKPLAIPINDAEEDKADNVSFNSSTINAEVALSEWE